MTLHPEARAFIEGMDTDASWDLDAEAVTAGRRSMREGSAAATGPVPELAVVRDVDAGGVPARLYDTGGDSPRPVVVHLHGGGWVFGDLDTHDGLCRLLAVGSGAAVLALDYRLAPEHPHPAALQDVDTALAWVRAGGLGSGYDSDRLALLGDSAGGSLAAVAARRDRDRTADVRPLRCQVLVYPVTGAAVDGPLWDAFGRGHGLDRDEMAFCWRSYVPDPEKREHPDVSPERAPSLAGSPPALVLTAECDPLRDGGERYAAALADAGAEVTAVRYAGMVHGFWRRPALFAASRSAIDTVSAYLARMLADG